MLQSRLTGGLTILWRRPDRTARLAVLRQLAALGDLQLPEPVAEVLAEGLSGTARNWPGGVAMQLADRRPELGTEPTRPCDSGPTISCGTEAAAAAESARDCVGHGAAFFACGCPTCGVPCGVGPW